MKKIKLMCGLLAFLVFAGALSGCTGNWTSSQILQDLETAGFMAEASTRFQRLSILDGECTTTCEIVGKVKTDTSETYACQVILSNSTFEMTYNVKVIYKGGLFSDYQIADVLTEMKSEIKWDEDAIVESVEDYFVQLQAESDRELTFTIEHDSISQDTDIENLKITISAKFSVTDGILSKEYIYTDTKIYSDYAGWEDDVECTVDTYNWDLQRLVGKKWVSSNGDYFVYIQSIDSDNSTAMLGYRLWWYSSTVDGPYEEHGQPIKVSYTLEIEKHSAGSTKDYIQFNDNGYKIKIYPDMGTDAMDKWNSGPEDEYVFPCE